MSGTVKRNKFIPIIVLGLLALLFLAMFVSCSPTSTHPGQGSAHQAPQGDNDTPTETLGSITGEVSLLSEQLTNLEAQSREKLQQELKRSAEDTKNELAQLEKKLSKGTEVMLGRLENKVLNLTEKLKNQNKTASVQPNYQVGQAPSRQGKIRSDGKLWITPAGGVTPPITGAVKTAAGASTNQNLFDQTLSAISEITPGISGGISGPGVPLNADSTLNVTTSTNATSSGSEKAQTTIPGVTIPPNATLIDSTLFTALVGRVPLGGVVQHPVPFKIINGPENLAANGIYIPGIKETIWSGVASGDGTLKCARGEINSVTFVFQDGTIVTQTSNKASPLGWITNERGFPCIPGEYVSNAPEVMTQLFFAGAAAGAGDAFAEGELTTITNDAGGVTQVLTGSGGKYVLGQGLGSGFSEWSRYIAERAKDKFDAVVVKPGLSVAININEMIEIDYKSGARKVSYLDPSSPYKGGLD